MDKNLEKPSALISVVMSVYNSSLYLKEAIDSILNQSYNNFEFIIINDGSKDKSLEMIKSYEDPRIILIDNGTNKGLIYSLNKGVGIAKGSYIARMDADDVSMPDRFEKQLQFMESHPEIGVCSSDYMQFNSSFEKKYSSFTDHDEILSFLLFNSSIVHPSLMIRKSVMDACEVLFDENYKHAEDYELWSRLIFKCKFSAVPSVLLKYRLHKHQITNVYSKTQVESADRIRENILKRCGFSFTHDELRVHCLLGSSTIITSYDDLMLLLSWFKRMISQNEKLHVIDQKVLLKALNKQWYDACGYTNLGLAAFKAYKSSDFKTEYVGNLTKLGAKCMVRRFRSA